jgi:iron complex outermembrane receptor protein
MQIGSTRKRIVLLAACSVASGVVFSARVWAQSAPAPIIVPTTPDTGNGPIIPAGPATPIAQAVHIAKIKKFYHELLLKEKNVAAAVSHVDQKQIEAVGQQGSIQSLLKQTPSVNEYQQNFGQGVPVITIRGVRYSQLAETLDGIPLQDLLSGAQGGFLNNNIGSPVSLGQISGSTVYPGVAPPDQSGFATVGGTIAYETKNPTSKPYAKIFAGIGTYNTDNFGFELNTGNIGKSVDAPRAILRYDQGYTDGYINYTNNRYRNIFAKIIKPYDDGLSNVSATVIYNTGDGYITTAPLPTALTQQYGPSYNFSKNLTYSRQNNAYLTAILGDETYINPHAIFSAKLFFLHDPNSSTDFQNPSTVSPNYNPSFPYQVTFQVPYFADGQIGPGTPFYHPPYFTYNPAIFGTINSPFGPIPSPGEAAQNLSGGTKTIGLSPKLNLFYGVNSITIGGLIAKETSLSGATYVYGSDPMPHQIGYNSFAFGGGSQRTVYSVYLQDRIDLLDNKLHIEPGVKVESAYTSSSTPFSFLYNQYKAYGTPTTPPFPDTNGAYRVQNFGKALEPYLGVSYDLPHHFVVYGSYGKSDRFAPIAQYGESSVGGGAHQFAPNPEVVHLYEAGLRYDTPRLYANVDYFYQKLNDAFGFYVNYATGAQAYSNIGVQQFRGEEASVKYRLTPAVELFGNASHLDARYLDSYPALLTPFQGQYGYVFKGNPLTSVPAWLGNFGVSYDQGPYSARFSGQYTGQQFTTFDYAPSILGVIPNTGVPQNPGGVPYALTTSPNTSTKLPGFLTLNVLLSYKLQVHFQHIKYIKLSLNVQNLLGLNYFSHLYSIYQQISNPAYVGQAGVSPYVNTSEYQAGYYGPPRSILFNVSAKF